MVGLLLLGSRELLRLFGGISRTSVSYSSLSELRIRELSNAGRIRWAGWGIFSDGLFQGGSTRRVVSVGEVFHEILFPIKIKASAVQKEILKFHLKKRMPSCFYTNKFFSQTQPTLKDIFYVI